MNNAMQSTVFIVEDNQTVRRVLTVSLENCGMSVESYDSAEGFLEAYVSQPGCLILDIRLPGMSGIKLQQALAEKQIKIPIIFSTGYGDVSTAVQVLKKGAIDFLEKPVSKEVLLNRVNEALAEDSRMRQDQARKHAALERYQTLTLREKEVMEHLVAGSANASNKEIAARLRISHRTVEDHRAQIIMKMQARSVSDLVDLAKRCEIYKP